MHRKLKPAFILPLIFQVITYALLSISTVSAADIDVVWTNLNAVTATGNDLVKTGATGWSTGYATSTESHSGDVGMKMTTTATSKTAVFGLGNSDSGSNYIPYSIYL
ncbi:MAG: hypothetical protein K8I00_11505, partial [Candidatus Omnitrophica bacterium]|nr:hypothetical protein [Candidatus Omnitrophota bacterium]